MRYTPTYFDFDKLEFYNEMLEVGILVFTIYAIIFLVSYIYSKFPPS